MQLQLGGICMAIFTGTIPRHYNAAGIVDGYVSKVEASSFSIGSMLVLYMMWMIWVC